MSILICRYNRVLAYPDDDITLSCHLSPETSAVPMEIRWFRENECICLYKNEQMNVNQEYKGRTSLFTQELVKGNVSLVLKGVRQTDTGVYCCQVFTGHSKVEKSIRLCMAGMEPLSPVSVVPNLTERNSVEMEESVQIIELKQLMQSMEKALLDNTKELEITNEKLRRNASLQKKDLESLSKLANEMDAQMKTNKLKKLLQSKTEELDITNKALENLERMVSKDASVQNEREGQLNVILSELEICKKDLKTLEQKLQERNEQVRQLKLFLQDKEQQLETTVHGFRAYQLFLSEIVEKNGDMLNSMYQSPKNQLEDIEKWISQKRKEKQIMDEQQMNARFKKEFQHCTTDIQELIKKEHGKMVVSAKRMDELEIEYNAAGTDKERQDLSEQLQDTFEILKKGEAQKQSLTIELDVKKNEIRKRHTQEIQRIREKYETVSKIEAETNILKIILPDVQEYFRNITENLKSFFEDHAATESQPSDHTDNPTSRESEYVMHQKSEVEPSINVTQETNNNVQTQVKRVMFKETWPEKVNGVIIEEDEIELKEGEQEEQE